MTVQHTDRWCIIRIRSGDIEALGELYERYKTQVYRTAWAITRDEKVAEDVLQDAFLRVYTYAGSFDETQPLGPWLYRVTVNLAYSWARRAKRWVNLVQDAFESLKSPQQSPENVAEERGQWRMLKQAIDALPDSQRVVIVLYYLEELSVKEIAYAIDVPEGTVKSRLHYARERLRKIMLEQERGLATEVAYDFTA